MRDVDSSEHYRVNLIARKTGFVLKVGNALTRYVLVHKIDGKEADVPTVKDYNEMSLRLALEKRPLKLPGVLGGGVLVVCVVVSDNEFTDELAAWVQSDSLKRRPSAVECTVLFTLQSHEVFFTNKPLLVGRAFFGEVRKIVDILMSL